MSMILRVLSSLALLVCLMPPPLYGDDDGIRVTRSSGLSFGTLVAEPTGGRIALAPDGGWVLSGSGLSPVSGQTRARILIKGKKGKPFKVQLMPALPRLKNGASQVTLLRFSSNLNNWNGVLDQSGLAEVWIGGELEVPAGAPEGTYRYMGVRCQVSLIGSSGCGDDDDDDDDDDDEGACSFDVDVTLRRPIALSVVRHMDFASAVVGPQPGTITLPPVGQAQPGGMMPPVLSGTPTAAILRLMGPAKAEYCLQLPTGDVPLTSGGKTLWISDFKSSLPSPKGTLPTAGLEFRVGATLKFNANQGPGIYTGTFKVLVNYL